jgi:hypothetical protein
MVALLVVSTLSGAVALALGKSRVRKQPDGSAGARTPVRTHRLARYTVPGTVVVLLLLLFAQSNWDRYAVLVMTTVLVALFAVTAQIRGTNSP